MDERSGVNIIMNPEDAEEKIELHDLDLDFISKKLIEAGSALQDIGYYLMGKKSSY